MTPVWFRSTCQRNGIDPSDDQLSQLDRFSALLLEWNKKINLISRRDEENIWVSHILHSVSVLFKLDIPQGASVLDLGTGGGLPGLPIKILRSDLDLTLLDSTQKKINVVREIASDLHLQKIQPVWGRAEEVGRKEEYAHRFDLVIARAVASLKDLTGWSVPFLRRQDEGQTERGEHSNHPTLFAINKPSLVALKGGDLEGEIRQIGRRADITNISIIDLTLEGSNQLEGSEKKLVVVEFGAAGSRKQIDS